jgi:hypothetical protein
LTTSKIRTSSGMFFDRGENEVIKSKWHKPASTYNNCSNASLRETN